MVNMNREIVTPTSTVQHCCWCSCSYLSTSCCPRGLKNRNHIKGSVRVWVEVRTAWVNRFLNATRMFFGSAPLCSLASCGRISANVLSAGRPSAAARVGSCSGAAADAVRNVGKKKASSLLAHSESSLPWRPLNRDSVPYWARRLQERGRGRETEKRKEEREIEGEREREKGSGERKIDR